MFCNNCGNKLLECAEFCIGCGTAVNQVAPEPADLSQAASSMSHRAERGWSVSPTGIIRLRYWLPRRKQKILHRLYVDIGFYRSSAFLPLVF